MTEVEPDDELPPPEVCLTLLGMALLELEWDHPGISERMIQRLESEATRRAIVRLRPPPHAEASAAAQDGALSWLYALSVLTSGMYPRRGKHGKRKRA